MTAAVGWIAGATAAFHLATANVWGYHRDEFYYLACGRRLAWGYVDHPPLTPLLYRIADVTFGPSQLGLRIFPALLHAASVVLVALLARELGGTARAQLAAALATALAPLLLTTGHFLGTVTVEITLGAALALVLVRLADGGDPRLWLLAGLLAGLGMLNKWTFGFALAGLAIGMLAGNRDALATPWLAAGAAVAAVLVAPTVAWQAAHDWPQLEFARTLRDYGQTPLVIPAQLLLLGPAAVFALPGIKWLAADSPTHRFLLVGFVVALAGVLVTGGKPYYTAAVALPLVAAGAVALADAGPWLVPTIAAVGVLLLPFATPVTPVHTADALRAVNPELGEMVGWEALADRVTALHAAHPTAAVVATNYSEAGSVELLASSVPQPASGQNSYWDWGPPPATADDVIVLGTGTAERLRDDFADARRLTTIRTPAGVHNQEDGTEVWLLTGRRRPWSEIWPHLRRV